jgi:hypothetical protein
MSNDTGNGLYYITVTFSRNMSDDSGVIGGDEPATTEQLLEQFALELQGTYDDPEHAMAGHWDVLAFNSAPLSDKQQQAVSQGVERSCELFHREVAMRKEGAALAAVKALPLDAMPTGATPMCNYSDCIEGHPVIPEDDESRRVTCPTCREDMGIERDPGNQ